MNKFIIIIFFIITTFFGCERLIIQDFSKTDSKSIFLEYATLVKNKYAMFDSKKIDIDNLINTIQPKITGKENEYELFSKLAIITRALRDGHSFLESKNYFSTYRYYSSTDIILTFNKLILEKYYWSSMNKLFENGAFYYGLLPNNKDIGYMYIDSFDIALSYYDIDNIFKTYRQTKALIIDIRNNSGGDPRNISKLVGYLTKNKYVAGVERFKTGSGKNDFSDNLIYGIPSKSLNTYTNPVYILMNKKTFSAATTLVYMTIPLRQVTTVGDVCGGGSGFFADGYLSNGWKWAFSVSEFVGLDGRTFDSGIAPNIYQRLDFTKKLPKTTDDIIERAVSEFRK